VLEWDRLQAALAVVRRAITQRHHRVNIKAGHAQAAIFEAHLLILEDAMLLAQVREQIFQHKRNAAVAWNTRIQEFAGSLRALPDPYLQQRANDVLDVGNQMLSVLLGQHTAAAALTFPDPVILVAQELTPTLIAQLDVSQVLGLVTIRGGPTDHSSILARALGIPAIAGVKASVLNTAAGTTIAIDGFKGKLWIDPSSQICQELQKRQTDWSTQRAQMVAASHQPATTRDGHNIRIAANAGRVLDAKTAIRNGAEAIGVLRTEFLYLTRNTPPSETEQVETLSQIGDLMGKSPIYVRTLDIGGDKAIPYLKLPEENNPFLGVRSIRLSLRTPDLFQAQLCSILRASANFDIRVMFPMISKIDELTQALQCLEKAHQILEDKNIPHRWPLETAIMIETPSAALLTSSFAKHTNFFSIGTNDLTQYTLAVERGNPDLIDYADGLHPSVLQLIRHVVDAAHQHGKGVAVCGELAGDLVAVPVLVGLGVDDLSLNPGNIPQVKVLIRKLNMAAASELAGNVLQTESEIEARRMAKEFIAKLDVDFS
jgi:phosphocarrier protein FPr